MGLLAFRTAVKPPTITSITATSTSRLDPIWTLPSGFTVELTELEFSLNGTSGWTLIFSGTALTFAHTGRSASTTYYYRARVKDTQGNYSLYSGVSNQTTPNTGYLKAHFGHYLLTPSTDAIVQADLNEMNATSNIRGLQHRMSWFALEPTKNNYDFTSIDAALNALPTGKFLILQVMDRLASTGSQLGIVPNYILSDSEYNGGVAPNNNGYRAKMYVPAVEERYTLLLEAIAAAYNDHPKFEGITLIESSSFNPIPSDVSSASALRDLLAPAIKRIVTRCTAAFTHCVVAQYSNSLVGKLSDVIRHCYQNRAGVGGPDVLPPPHSDVSGSRIASGEETDSGSIPITDYRLLCPMMYAIQGPEMGGKESDEALGAGNNWTPAQFMAHAITTRGAHYVCTLRSEAAVIDAPLRWTAGWAPYFAGSPQATIQTAPANYAGYTLVTT